VSEIQIRPVRYGSPVAQRLIEAIFEDQVLRYGGRDESEVEAIELDPPDGGFLVRTPTERRSAVWAGAAWPAARR